MARRSADSAGMVARQVTIGSDVRALENCDIVIEAVYENMETKTDVLKQLSDLLPPEALIAS
ncbi:3-hydroxyacyl-CoA dehydrogenase NAD-binding domain-containing protein, partial [Microvirga pakistanensis]|uniref:3-hydroxyacyl-CoA dehydrogenase NAD-binding domain-containing protein n=1 Tax=Microvirga pakistanensis TaxID=1682650 RepID=UPI003CC7D240